MLEKLAQVFGGSILEGVTELIKTFKLSPEEAARLELALKKTEVEFQSKILELQVSDMNSARQREIQVRDDTPRVLAYVTTGLFGAVLFYMMSFELPTGSERVIDVMLGSLGTAWLMSMSYYFGSSIGSDAKTSLMDKLFRINKKD